MIVYNDDDPPGMWRYVLIVAVIGLLIGFVTYKAIMYSASLLSRPAAPSSR